MEPRHHNRAANNFQLYDNSSDEESSGSHFDDVNIELWVFGYGSLCWYPGFDYKRCVTGYIRGYVRRFWQGNTTHRGTQEKPGRVVTLVEDTNGITWGCAYKIVGRAALKYLGHRECDLGGYVTQYTKFYPRVAADHMDLSGEAFPALLYIATEDNSLWMGDAELPTIAKEISESEGASGHNVEYLMRLANFMREALRGVSVEDDHLFELERLVKEILIERKVCIRSLMGRQPERIRRDSHEAIHRPVTFAFTSRVPDKKLRCLNI